MKIYKIPSSLRAIIFDIDSTLYTSKEYAFEQVDCQIRQFAKENHISDDEARKKIIQFRKNYAEKNDGKKISLGNTLLNFGVPIEKSIEWRKNLLEPSEFLHFDEKLINSLDLLKNQFKLICVTNNPILPARKTLESIGISHFFPQIIGLDSCFKSKPAKEPFLLAVEKIGCKIEECLSVGDRFDIDISLPLEMGMGGILVDGVKDVYNLNEILQNR